VRYAIRTPAVLFVLVALAVVGTLGFNWPVAVPLLAKDVLHVQADGFGALMAAFGAGALIAGLGLVVWGGGNERRLVTAGGLLGVVLLLLGMSRSYPVSLALMGLAGLTGTVFTTTANTRLQLLSPDRLRGRVMSLFVLLMAGSTPIGASLLGQGAEAFGVPATIVAFGVATLIGLAALVVYRTMTAPTATAASTDGVDLPGETPAPREIDATATARAQHSDGI
jgi:predicted MFS family arabinose efflux permease